MTIKYSLSNIIMFLVVGALQVMVFNNVNVYGVGFPMIYPMVILFIPVMQPAYWVLPAAFLTGMSMDFFMDTGGLHAAATTFMAFIRIFTLYRLAPQAGYGAEDSPGIGRFGIQWMLIYCLILLTAHHLFYFILEGGGFHRFGLVLLKTILSTGLSLLLIITLNAFIFRR